MFDGTLLAQLEPLSNVPVDSQYTMSDDLQGISSGWSAVYGRSLEDQWIDVTGVKPGKLMADPHFTEEKKFFRVPEVPAPVEEPESTPEESEDVEVDVVEDTV